MSTKVIVWIDLAMLFYRKLKEFVPDMLTFINAPIHIYFSLLPEDKMFLFLFGANPYIYIKENKKLKKFIVENTKRKKNFHDLKSITINILRGFFPYVWIYIMKWDHTIL